MDVFNAFALLFPFNQFIAFLSESGCLPSWLFQDQVNI